MFVTLTIEDAKKKPSSTLVGQLDERDRVIDRMEKRLATLLVEVQDLRKRVYG
ncbi:hypothetical protein [Neorhizobium galegae]|uniref:hypothetical protein n=1 Tax=Neorhizobium galegae TaxID=399 RepID=UPI0017872482|nr:hypothetical protein [Neorhizobium galegae]